MQDLMPPINTQDSIFHDGDPTTGQLGTIVTALWLNNVQAATCDVQAEIKNVLAKAGMTPDPKKNNQLADAISQIVSSGNYASTAYVDNGLNKKIDKANISGVKGNDNDKVPSLNLFTTETGKLATKAELTSGLAGKQPAGEYATTQALNDGLNQKFDNAGGIVSGKITTESGYLTSKYLDTSIEINSFDQENPHIAVSVDSGKSWSKHRFQSKSGTLAHTSDISDVIALLNNIVPIGQGVIWNGTWDENDPIAEYFWPARGRRFSATAYPIAAKRFPDLQIPDDRGYAIRIADDGRGIDPGREVGTYQEDAIRNITGGFLMTTGFSDKTTPSGAFAVETGYQGAAGKDWNGSLVTFDPSRVVPVANENRMKNVAKILIIRMK
ncbi:TPA: hypothetical protein ACS724_001235 [Providencia alcalifaciens]